MASADPVRLAVTVGFIGASLFAAYGGYRAIIGARQPSGPAPVQVAAAMAGTPVLTASAPIPRGDVISAPALRAIMVEGSTPPAGTFAEPEAVVGKVATTDILPGQILLASMITSDRADAGLAVLIPPGKRAIAIPIAEDVAVSNLVRAGDLVDVLLVLRSGVLPHAAIPVTPAPASGPPPTGAAPPPSDPGDVSETRILLQAVPVLTLGDHLGGIKPTTPTETGGRLNQPSRPEASRTLTLALTPEETETIALARTLGTLELALRNPEDADVSKRRAITLRELRGASARSEAEPPPEPEAGPKPGADARRPIELIVGSEHRTIYSLDAGLPHLAGSQGTMRTPGVRGP
jgi:pilus assembly protein CpaB